MKEKEFTSPQDQVIHNILNRIYNLFTRLIVSFIEHGIHDDNQIILFINYIMSRSGHRPQVLIKKEIKPVDLTRSIRAAEEHKVPHEMSKSSKSKGLKHSKKLSSSKLKQLDQKHQDYYKTGANNLYPSKEGSTIKANLSNDYCVNEYFVRSTKVKNLTQSKRDIKNFNHNQQYGNDFKQVNSQIQPYSQEYGFDVQPQKTKQTMEQSRSSNNKISSMMKKISFSDKRALINIDGKIVSSSKEKPKKSQLNKSSSQNTLSFSKQYLSKNDGKKKSKSRSKIKSRSKQIKLNTQRKGKEENRQKETYRQQKIIGSQQRTMKKKSKQKLTASNRKDFILIKNQPQPQPPTKNTSSSKHLNLKIKHSIYSTKQQPNQISETLTSNSTEQFSYYQRYPTSTTLIDNSSSSSSSSNFTLALNSNTPVESVVDFGEVAQEIAAEINASGFMTVRKEFKMKGSFFVERMKCLNLIGNICAQLKTKRDTYCLAVCYFDKYILNTDCHNMKIIALTAIMMSLKMDLPQLLPKYCLSFRPNPQATIKKTSKSHKKKKSQISSSSSILKQKDSFLDTKDRLTTLITLPIYSNGSTGPQSQLYSSNDKQEDFHIGEIIQAQIEVMCRLKWKFYHKSIAYWVDLLTTLWDSYMEKLCEQDSKQHKPSTTSDLQPPTRIFFKRTATAPYIKHHKDFKLFSYLTQAAQSTLSTIQSYKHSPITLTLSIMYLLVRLYLQQQRTHQPLSVYRYYRQNLSKSCNLIFCDNLGMNEVFGNFLNLVNLNMAVIVQAVQFVSRFIVPEEFKIFNYKDTLGDTYQDRLANYIYNPNLFRLNHGK